MNRLRGMELASFLAMVLITAPALAADPQGSRSGPVKAQAGQTLVDATKEGLQILVKPPVGDPTTFVFNTPNAPSSAVPRLRGNAEVLFSRDGVVAIFHDTAEAVLVRVDGAAADLGMYVPSGYRLTTFEGGSLLTKRAAISSTATAADPNRKTNAPNVLNQDPGGGDGGPGAGCSTRCSISCGGGSSCDCTAGAGFCCSCSCSATSGASCSTSRY